MRRGLGQSIILAGLGVFAYSVWDKGYETHDRAEKVRAEVWKQGNKAYDNIKAWLDKFGL